MTDQPSVIEFPCAFPIKAMGHRKDDFDALVVELVRRHQADISEGAVTTRLSKGGNYISVTVTVQAQSQKQLDAIYRELSADERVLVAL